MRRVLGRSYLSLHSCCMWAIFWNEDCTVSLERQHIVGGLVSPRGLETATIRFLNPLVFFFFLRLRKWGKKFGLKVLQGFLLYIVSSNPFSDHLLEMLRSWTTVMAADFDSRLEHVLAVLAGKWKLYLLINPLPILVHRVCLNHIWIYSWNTWA